jgi:hypothetical protein
MEAIAFRTPAAGYHWEPALLDHIKSIIATIHLISQLEEAPFGWNTNRLELIQHGDEAIIVVPVFGEGDKHIADLPIVRLPEGWLDSCCFPLFATHTPGEC